MHWSNQSFNTPPGFDTFAFPVGGELNIIFIIIHSKYFPDSDWLKAHI